MTVGSFRKLLAAHHDVTITSDCAQGFRALDHSRFDVAVADLSVTAMNPALWSAFLSRLAQTCPLLLCLHDSRCENPGSSPNAGGGFTVFRPAAQPLRQVVEEALSTASVARRSGRDETAEALRWAGWNEAKAARKLSISRETLYRRIRRYRLLEPPESLL